MTTCSICQTRPALLSIKGQSVCGECSDRFLQNACVDGHIARQFDVKRQQAAARRAYKQREHLRRGR